jgi:RNA polymerase sigma-70 factor (ECF subfamily)
MAFAPRAPKKLHAWLRHCSAFGLGASPATQFEHNGVIALQVRRSVADSLFVLLQLGGPGIVSPAVGATASNGSWPMLAIADGDAAQAGESIVDFDSVVSRYEKQIFNAIYQWIGDYEEAADLTQETFLSAYKARDQFRGDARLYTWLYRIAYNHCKNRFKQRDRQRQMEGVSLDAGVSDGDGDELVSETREIPDWSYSPARILEQKELRALVDRAVESLASEYKVVLLLRELDGLSYNEIAEVTGLTMEAVKTRLNRARGMVRQRVEPYYKT